ncbi:MAG: hypothetical protein IJQ66_03845 [Clostridia bacterium]|nr:hypothetical protein [Clostridia bacterium]
MLNKRIITHPVHGECLFLNNGVIEIGVPLTFGIRIAHLSFVGEENVFFVQPNDMKMFTFDSGLRIRGGHRLWIAPESPDDYYADNEPIEYGINGDTVTLTQKNDPLLNVIKSMEITLKGNTVSITHRVKNTGKRRKIALWALTVMKSGGVLTVPLREREGGYDPLTHISAWDYTDLSDERLKFGKKEIKIYQRAGKRNLKVGVGHPAGAVSYENGDTVFKKHIPLYSDKEYADGGVSFETFISDYMAEIEGLSPLVTLLPDKTATYTESWELLRKK